MLVYQRLPPHNHHVKPKSSLSWIHTILDSPFVQDGAPLVMWTLVYKPINHYNPINFSIIYILLYYVISLVYYINCINIYIYILIIILYEIVSYHVILYYVTVYYIILYYVTLYFTIILSCTISNHVIPYYIILYCIKLNIISYHMIFYYIILYYTIFNMIIIMLKILYTYIYMHIIHMGWTRGYTSYTWINHGSDSAHRSKYGSGSTFGSMGYYLWVKYC